MPLYDYGCDMCGYQVELFFKIADAPASISLDRIRSNAYHHDSVTHDGVSQDAVHDQVGSDETPVETIDRSCCAENISGTLNKRSGRVTFCNLLCSGSTNRAVQRGKVSQDQLSRQAVQMEKRSQDFMNSAKGEETRRQTYEIMKARQPDMYMPPSWYGLKE